MFFRGENIHSSWSLRNNTVNVHFYSQCWCSQNWPAMENLLTPAKGRKKYNKPGVFGLIRTGPVWMQAFITAKLEAHSAWYFIGFWDELRCGCCLVWTKASSPFQIRLKASVRNDMLNRIYDKQEVALSKHWSATSPLLFTIFLTSLLRIFAHHCNQDYSYKVLISTLLLYNFNQTNNNFKTPWLVYF